MTDATDDTEDKRDGGKRLTVVQWLEVCNLAKNGTPVSVIAEQYGVGKTSIYRGLDRRGVKIGELVERAKREEEEAERKKMIEKIKKTKDNSYNRIEIIEGIAISLIADQRRNSSRLGDIQDDMKTLDKAMSIAIKGLSGKWKLLGLDRENAHADEAIPELVVRELTQFEVDEIRRKQRVENGDLTAEEMALLNETISGEIDEELNGLVEEGI